LHKALNGKRKKHGSMTDEEWEYLDAKSLSTIQLCLANDILFNIVGEETTTCLWSRM
jgi:hypothetical protein